MTRFTDYIFDLCQNAINAEATHIEIMLFFDEKLEMTIIDNGKGMNHQTLNQVRQFSFSSNKHRKVGLGLSMIHDLTLQTEGSFDISSIPEVGTVLSLSFNPNHIDFPEFGNLGLCISDLYMTESLEDIKLVIKKDRDETFHLNHQFLKDKSYLNKLMIESDINEEIHIYRREK